MNVCANPHATVALDPYSADNEAGTTMAAALANGCMPAVAFRTTTQDAGVAEDPATGRPITGPGDTLVAAGGYFGQRGVAYMETAKIAPLTLGTDGTNSWIRNIKTGANVVLVASSMLTAHHDYFALEVSVEPISGTLCFFGYGMLVPGTAAAAYYFQNDIVANRATFPGVWYVYEWTDTDNSGIAERRGHVHPDSRREADRHGWSPRALPFCVRHGVVRGGPRLRLRQRAPHPLGRSRRVLVVPRLGRARLRSFSHSASPGSERPARAGYRGRALWRRLRRPGRGARPRHAGAPLR